MSYANLVSQVCTNNAEAFKRIRDFVCKRSGSYDYSSTGIGWTLHDAVYATDEDTVAFNDYFVIYSPGEDGDQDIYIKITYISGYINVHTYLYWNNSTHVGVQASITNSNFTATNSTALTLWVYGDLDSLFLVVKDGSTYYAIIAGHCPDSQFATGVATSSGAVSSGSAVVVTVDAVPEGWAAGRKIYIRDTAHVEICTISAISGTDVTLAKVTNSYAAGCKLQGEVSYYCGGSNNVFYSIFPVISHSGATVSQHTLDASSVVGATTNDGLLGGAVTVPIYQSQTTSFIGPLKNVSLVSNSGRTSEQTETDQNGDTYRYFNCYFSKYILVKEV